MGSMRIENLSDLFYELFNAEDGGESIIQGHMHTVREDYLKFFFPQALCDKYLGKSKSNLTWFFNNDRRNRAIKSALLKLATEDLQAVDVEMHQKCRHILYPQNGHASFDNQRLLGVLQSIRLKNSINSHVNISSTDREASWLKELYEADPSAALARMLLTLALMPDADDQLLIRLWSGKSVLPGMAYKTFRSIPEALYSANLLYLDGEHEKAFQIYRQAARQISETVNTYEESQLCCRLAMMLHKGDGHYRDEEAALQYYKMACFDGNPESYRLFAQYAAGSEEEALAALQRSADLGNTRAIRELGNAWFLGSYPAPEQNLENAEAIYRRVSSLQDKDSVHCLYMLGRIREEKGDFEGASRIYACAFSRGSADAGERLAQMDWNRYAASICNTPAIATEKEGQRCICIMNKLTGANVAFGESLDTNWQVTLCDSSAAETAIYTAPCRVSKLNVRDSLINCVSSMLSQSETVMPEIVISLLSDRETDNLRDAMLALNAILQLALQYTEQRKALLAHIHLFVLAKHEDVDALLDAAFEGMHGLAFDLRVCDPDCDAVDSLYSNAPVFLPIIRQNEAKCVRVVIIGGDALALEAAIKATALPFPEGTDVSVSVLYENAEEKKIEYARRCPGVYSAEPIIRRVIPKFISCPVNIDSLCEIIRARRMASRERNTDYDAAAGEIGKAVCKGNYYIVAAGSDLQNIGIGRMLREEFMKCDPNLAHTPFIAVHVRDGGLARLAGRMSSGVNGDSKYSHYNLYCFGAYSDLYTRQNLFNDLLERKARAVHLHYMNCSADGAAEAMSSYYRRQYNRSSSRSCALSFIYRMFQDGFALSDWRLYGDLTEETELARTHHQWLQQDENLANSMRHEHERWNCQMLSMGWEQANIDQVAAYVERGNPSHQLYIARLHPLICDWEQIKGGTLYHQIKKILQNSFPERSIHDPVDADRDIVDNMENILSECARIDL